MDVKQASEKSYAGLGLASSLSRVLYTHQSERIRNLSLWADSKWALKLATTTVK